MCFNLSCTKGGNRTRTILLSLDFESSASTNSATLAFGGANIHISFIFHNIHNFFQNLIMYCEFLLLLHQSQPRHP